MTTKPQNDRSKLATDGPLRMFGANAVLGESTHRALEEADAWIVDHSAARPDRTERPGN